VLLLLGVAAVSASQKHPETAGARTQRTSRVGRTWDGRPDLQGLWTFSSLTPFERPAEFAGKAFVTGAEAVAFQKLINKKADATAATDPGYILGYDPDEFFEDGIHGAARREKVDRLPTSLIVDPPDGRLPALTAFGRQRTAAAVDLLDDARNDGPEGRSLGERCLVAFNAGPPIMPGAYNNNLQVVQTHDYVVVMTEMIHSVRTIPLDGRPHLPASLRQWSGDSRGRWDGDTLVIETTNFHEQLLLSPAAAFRGSDDKRVIERFTRVDRGTLRYEFTVIDPAVYTVPWTARVDMHPGTAMYEYGCHEANYALRDILSGLRVKERQAAKPRPTR
jgi:hypothetical protein